MRTRVSILAAAAALTLGAISANAAVINLANVNGSSVMWDQCGQIDGVDLNDGIASWQSSTIGGLKLVKTQVTNSSSSVTVTVPSTSTGSKKDFQRDAKSVALSGTLSGGSVYGVTGNVMPALKDGNYRAGITGGLDTTTGTGIVLYYHSTDGLRIRSIDFDPDWSLALKADPEVLTGLYTTSGTALTSTTGKAAYSYTAGDWINMSLDFQAPTESDLTALPTATARVVATMGSSTLTVLTNLPVGQSAGFYGYGGGTTGTTPTDIAYFQVPEPGAFAMVGLGAFGLLARRRRD